MPHFRAHERRTVRLTVGFTSQRWGAERQALVLDLSLAGAGLETEEPLLEGERVAIALATPTMWDPLVLEGVVAWAHPVRTSHEVDAIGRVRAVARSGVAFEYPTPAQVLAMFQMLATLGYE